MPDERTGSTDDVDGADTSDPAPRRRPSATSRARRIGGLAGTPVPKSDQTAADPAADTADGATGGSARPVPPKPPRPSARLAVSTTKATETPAATGHETGEKPDELEESYAKGGSSRAVAWATWAPAGVLTAAVIAMVVVIAVVSHGVWWGQRYNAPSRTNPLRQQVSAAAKTCLARTNSYDYRNLGAFEKAGLACTTGQETAQFRQAVDGIIKVNAVKLKATQSAQINTTGIEVVSGNQWTLLVYGQLKVTNTSTPKGRVDPFAAQVRMEKVHGKWLLAAEKVVSQPSS